MSICDCCQFKKYLVFPALPSLPKLCTYKMVAVELGLDTVGCVDQLFRAAFRSRAIHREVLLFAAGCSAAVVARRIDAVQHASTFTSGSGEVQLDRARYMLTATPSMPPSESPLRMADQCSGSLEQARQRFRKFLRYRLWRKAKEDLIDLLVNSCIVLLFHLGLALAEDVTRDDGCTPGTACMQSLQSMNMGDFADYNSESNLIGARQFTAVFMKEVVEWGNSCVGCESFGLTFCKVLEHMIRANWTRQSGFDSVECWSKDPRVFTKFFKNTSSSPNVVECVFIVCYEAGIVEAGDLLLWAVRPCFVPQSRISLSKVEDFPMVNDTY